MQQTISENLVLYLLGTVSISCILLYTAKVKNLEIYDNSQVTNAQEKNTYFFTSTLVGTSEAIRLLNKKSNTNYKNTRNKFNQWLAGLIDGDGCFLLSKKGFASLEITMDLRDERALQAIKEVYGGSIKLRSGAKAVRYRLHDKKGLLNLISDVNGHIRNPTRLIQFNYILTKYEITLKLPCKLSLDNGWLSGFFDADGTVAINSSNWQLSISAGQKTTEILHPLVEIFGGYIYIDRGGNGSFKWYVTKKSEIDNLIEYFKVYPSKSAKNNRLHLIPLFYELKSMKAHIASVNSLQAKAWEIFLIKWNNYNG